MAAAARAHQWASLPLQVLTHPKCPYFLSGRLCHNGRTDECWQALVLCFLLTAPLSSALDKSFKEDKMSLVNLMPTWAHMVGSRKPLKHVYSMVEVPNFFPGHPVPYQLDGRYIHLGSPVLGGPARNCSKLTSLLPSTQIQQPVQTSTGG